MGIGQYSVDVPHITAITGATSNPTIRIHECGRIQVRVTSFQGGREGDIWINWIDGTFLDETTTNNVEHGVPPYRR